MTIDFTNLDTLKSLDSYLADKSYIEGYKISPADATILKKIEHAPNKDTMPHLHRWHKHISYLIKENPNIPSNLDLEKFQTIFASKPIANGNEDDDDLFASDDEEDAEYEKVKQERLALYAAKKSKKEAIIAKSSIVLDVKPWDTETDMKKMEECVRSIHADGLVWGAAKLVPLAYGIKKLQINCVVEDDKIGTDYLEEKITEFEDLIQSVDVAAFNKI